MRLSAPTCGRNSSTAFSRPIRKSIPPHVESLGDHWGDLCATKELASGWADQLLPTLKNVLRERKRGTYPYFFGTTLCYSALFKADRQSQILELLAMDPRPIWPYLCLATYNLVRMGSIGGWWDGHHA